MRTATRSRARESRRRTSWTRRSAPRMAPSSTTTSPCSCRASRPQLPSSSGFATRATAAASSTRAAGPPCPRTSSSLLRRLRLRRARHLFSYGRVAQPRVAARPSRQARLHTQVGRAPDRDGQRNGQDGDVLQGTGTRWLKAAVDGGGLPPRATHQQLFDALAAERAKDKRARSAIAAPERLPLP